MEYDIHKLKLGDKSEYEKIYYEFYDVLYSLSVQYLKNKGEAEEIVQDSFLKLWEVRQDLNDQSNIKNFLYTLVKNKCLNSIRDKQNSSKALNDYNNLELKYSYEALNRLTDSYITFKELKDRIDTAIDELPEDLKVVFKMNRFEDLKYKEIATQLELSEKTVEARMSKALKILRKDLKDYLPVIYVVTDLLS